MPLDIYDVVIDAMPGTINQMVASTGLSYSGIWRAIQCLVNKECYISDWALAKKSYRYIAIYAAGKGTNAPYPPKAAKVKIEPKPKALPAPVAPRKRGRMTNFEKATMNSNRHFNILNDDEVYRIMPPPVAPPPRDPMVAAIFGSVK